LILFRNIFNVVVAQSIKKEIKMKAKLSLLALVLGMSTTCFAIEPHISISGVIPAFVKTHLDPDKHVLLSSVSQNKPILLERISLSKAAKLYLAENITKPQSRMLLSSQNGAPTHVQLDMNGVPVLDQGMHGTCATFATTAAIDAVLGHSDYISQLCNLELGSYLESKNRNYPSGWEGSTNEIVLSQIAQYGIINQNFQKKTGCSGVRSYPVSNERSMGSPMTADDFTQHSEKVMKQQASWITLLDMELALSKRSDMTEVLGKVKQGLSAGHRMVIGTLIDQNLDNNGAEGSYKIQYDSWVLTPEIARDAQDQTIQAGHAMIVTGYDDNAVITDSDHRQHKGVLALRNSWGSIAGDKGTYYMSYDYFTNLVLEVKEIIPGAKIS
jgi:C1A family cysteine protease